MLSYLLHNRVMSHATLTSLTNRFKLPRKTIGRNRPLSSHCIINSLWSISYFCFSVHLVPCRQLDVFFNKLKFFRLDLIVRCFLCWELQTLSWCQIVVRISKKREKSYSDQTQQKPDKELLE